MGEGVMEHTTHCTATGRVEVELSSAEEVQTTATTTEGMTGVCLKRCSASEDAPIKTRLDDDFRGWLNRPSRVKANAKQYASIGAPQD